MAEGQAYEGDPMTAHAVERASSHLSEQELLEIFWTMLLSRRLDERAWALHAKLRLLRPDGALGLALLGQVGLPFGDMPRSMAADPGVWYWPRLAAEKRFGRTRRLKTRADP